MANPPFLSGLGVAFRNDKRKFLSKPPSPGQCISLLSGSSQHGVICRGGVWLACTRQLAYVFDRVCLGRRLPREAAAGLPLLLNALKNQDSDVTDTQKATKTDTDNMFMVRFSLEETFYAVWILNCLTVHTSSSNKSESAEGDGNLSCRLSRSELWRTLIRLENARSGGQTTMGICHLISRICSYLHFRRVGWFPKSGLQYGSDFVLYYCHPSTVHSEYCVVLHPHKAGNALRDDSAIAAQKLEQDCALQSSSIETDQLASWADVQAVTRLCGQVSKSLVAAYMPCAPEKRLTTHQKVHEIWMKEMRMFRLTSEKLTKNCHA